MADTFTGTDWKTHTKITTEIMKALDEQVEANKEDIKENSDLIEGLDAFLSSAGTSLSNVDLNDITTPGKYYTTGSNNTGTLENCPVTGYAISMWVFKLTNSRTCQIIIRNMDARLYIRSDVEYGWYVFTGTAV